MKNNSRDKKGFTLAELMIIVAIMAVLVTVGMPVFSASLGKSKAAVCLANRRSLLAELTASYLLDGDNYAKPDLRQYSCPSGGVISYSMEYRKFKVECSVHSGWTNDTVPNAFEAVLNDYTDFSVDSTAIKGAGNTANLKLDEILKKLAEKGIDMSTINAASWSLKKDAFGAYLSWSTVDITACNVGDTIPVIRYRANGTYAGQYSVWLCKVTTATANGATYNILSTNGKELSTELDTTEKKDIGNIRTVYNEYADSNKLPTV